MRQTENSLQLREIEKRIGYEFKDKSLPETAFTHSSYANERKLRSNENMEFFGDAILEFLVSEYLYKNFPDKNEGDFSRARAAVVSRDRLFLAVKKMGLEEFLLISNAQALATENSKIRTEFDIRNRKGRRADKSLSWCPSCTEICVRSQSRPAAGTGSVARVPDNGAFLR